MALNFVDEDNEEQQVYQLFSHSRIYEQGLGTTQVRRAENVIIVAQDGTGDFGTIQEALNQIGSGGGEIFIKDGIYILKDNATTIPYDNIKISGNGVSTELRVEGSDDMLLSSSKNDLTFENLKFSLVAGTADTTINLSGERVLIKNCTNKGVELTISGSYGKIIGCSFIGDSSGLLKLTGSYSVVNGCSFNNLSLQIMGNYISAVNCSFAGTLSVNIESGNCGIISGCSLYNTQGILINSGDYSVVNGNIINGASNQIGIHVYRAANCNAIVGNTVTGCFVGVYLEAFGGGQPDRTVVVGNVIYGNTTNYTNDGMRTLSYNITS